MKLQLKYKGKNFWSYPTYVDQNRRRYGNIDMVDNNDLNSIFLLTNDYEEPLCAVCNINSVDEVEITHEDGRVDIINVAHYNDDNKPYNIPACLPTEDIK